MHADPTKGVGHLGDLPGLPQRKQHRTAAPRPESAQQEKTHQMKGEPHSSQKETLSPKDDDSSDDGKGHWCDAFGDDAFDVTAMAPTAAPESETQAAEPASADEAVVDLTEKKEKKSAANSHEPKGKAKKSKKAKKAKSKDDAVLDAALRAADTARRRLKAEDKRRKLERDIAAAERSLEAMAAAKAKRDETMREVREAKEQHVLAHAGTDEEMDKVLLDFYALAVSQGRAPLFGPHPSAAAAGSSPADIVRSLLADAQASGPDSSVPGGASDVDGGAENGGGLRTALRDGQVRAAAAAAQAQAPVVRHGRRSGQSPSKQDARLDGGRDGDLSSPQRDHVDPRHDDSEDQDDQGDVSADDEGENEGGGEESALLSGDAAAAVLEDVMACLKRHAESVLDDGDDDEAEIGDDPAEGHHERKRTDETSGDPAEDAPAESLPLRNSNDDDDEDDDDDGGAEQLDPNTALAEEYSDYDDDFESASDAA